MCAGQWELGRSMVESRGRLPCARSMATCAIIPQLAAMIICVAAHAVAGKTEVGVVQILGLNAGTRRGRDIRGFMTIVTARGSVPAGKRKAGLAVIYSFAVGLPPNQRKIRSIVFGMAAHAVLAGSVGRQPNGMHPLSLHDALPDFRVTIQTPELDPSAAKFVALRAAQRTGKRFVRFRERSGRDLCSCRNNRASAQ